MAKIKGPLHSDTAAGSLGACLTFSKRASGQQVRFQRKQKDVITDKRIVQRTKFLLGLAFWETLPDEEKKYWYTWQWTNDGQSYFFKKTPSDLVEVKEKEIVTRWINVYGYPLTLSMHETKEEADKYDFVKRISCTKIEIEYEEGEGL